MAIVSPYPGHAVFVGFHIRSSGHHVVKHVIEQTDPRVLEVVQRGTILYRACKNAKGIEVHVDHSGSNTSGLR